jgi:hypothetical protein
VHIARKEGDALCARASYQLDEPALLCREERLRSMQGAAAREASGEECAQGEGPGAEAQGPAA